METTGHSAYQGGLRGHSIGGEYPEVVIGVGEGFALLNVLTGETGPVRRNYQEAAKWREMGQPCPSDCPRLARACHWCEYHCGPEPVKGAA